MKPPTFELRIPRLGEKPVAPPPPEEEPLAPEPLETAPTLEEIVPSRGEARPATSLPRTQEETAAQDVTEAMGGEELGADGQPLRMWDLLSQIRSHDVAQNSYKSPFRETREELVQRLLDPPLTLEEAARLLGVCPTTVRRYTNKGQLRHFRTTGNQRRFRLSDVMEFLESRASEIEADARADREAGLQ
jgi:excisionase family DNA binding protein